MAGADIFAYAIGREGRFVGFLEGDDDNSWFYLQDLDIDPDDCQIIGAVQVYLGVPDFTEADVEVHWYDGEMKVGVFIKGELGAYFDLATRWGYPGTYWKTRKALAAKNNQPDTPPQTG
ncbi:MAG TPA: hypothetical protein VGK90_09890 [Rhizomicrobium sp.]|jgi:hypothetical protein